MEADIEIAGDSRDEAIGNLKSFIVATYEDLVDAIPEVLDPGPGISKGYEIKPAVSRLSAEVDALLRERLGVTVKPPRSLRC